ncbi:MAG: hypothetical protein IPI18_21060 [Saprospiraceae bacterium]|nr:hypothetical protein [Saprospiraceae bacterium]
MIVITLVGLFQDQLFQLIDKIINPHKYYKSRVDGLSDASIGFMAWVAAIIIGILAGMFPAVGIMKYGAWILGAAGTLFFVLGFFKINKANQ